MTGLPTRGLMLRMGRSSLDSCVRAGGLTQPGLDDAAGAAFDRLADRATWPGQMANQFYLAVFVLPVAALYTALREQGWAQPDAVDATRASFLATGEHERALFTLVFRTALGRRLFLRSLRPNWFWLTPPPANQWTVSHRTSERVTGEVSRCYRWDAFRLLGTPEVARVVCDYEEFVFSGSPRLRVGWSCMPGGHDRCRFCLESVAARADDDVSASA